MQARAHTLPVVGMTIVDNSDEADDQTPRMEPNGLRNGTGQKTKKRLWLHTRPAPTNTAASERKATISFNNQDLHSPRHQDAGES